VINKLVSSTNKNQLLSPSHLKEGHLHIF